MPIESDPKKNSSPPHYVPSSDLRPRAIPAASTHAAPVEHPREIGGPSGPEPTRYGDWERKGRCIDF